jgi:hypothetical protein
VLSTSLDAIDTLGVTLGFTVVVIPELVAVVVAKQVSFDVNTQVTTSLFANVVVVNVEAFVPAFEPFTFHWYVGVVPPFVGVAVNVTLSPAQIVLSASLDAILTLGVRFVFTVVVIPVLVAVVGLAHVAFDVNTQVTTSPLANVAFVNVDTFVPTLPPFNFH